MKKSEAQQVPADSGEKLAKGFRCECGAWEEYPAWLFAHWDDRVNHTCDVCGRKHVLFRGEARLIGQPAPKRTQKKRR